MYFQDETFAQLSISTCVVAMKVMYENMQRYVKLPLMHSGFSILLSFCWASSLDQSGCRGLPSTCSSSCQASDMFADPTWSQPY